MSVRAVRAVRAAGLGSWALAARPPGSPVPKEQAQGLCPTAKCTRALWHTCAHPQEPGTSSPAVSWKADPDPGARRLPTTRDLCGCTDPRSLP